MLLEQIVQDETFKLFVDLDGVLANFTKGAKEILHLDHSEERFETDKEFRNEMWSTLKKYQDEQGGEFWYELDMMPDAKTLWSYVSQYEPEILTATGDPKYGAGEQKRKWVAEHLGTNVKVNLSRKADEKAKLAGTNHVLIDDKMKAIQPWRDAGGIGILHTSAANTINELKKIGL